MTKLTPMDGQQRRLIKKHYIDEEKYLVAWNCRVSRYYRIMFGRSTWTTSIDTKHWFNRRWNVLIYHTCRGRRRFTGCVK